ncbi:Pre-mRNA-splicing factor SPF27 [Holothuria leucospilota]|uniref:Pre-mRNA-splicing factor SPF27 n=1 Tax=Holothuria leucospilota TaxID=206669 RepID=A0A9Q1BCJ7_HOLLE|nr:Pre-mRNA-splicing factor SPF27 [Holothuria leucospilota]
MAGEVFIDALPYYDQGYDEPGIKEAAYALIEEETRRYRPTKNYLELLTPIDQLPFETEILKREFERMASRLPMESLSMKRYELPPPPIGRQNDHSAWTECVENSMAQLEHQAERIANLELLSKYGSLAWRIHNDLLTKMLEAAQKQLQAIRKQIQEINWNRKKEQTESGTTLKTLQESWVKLVTKNYEIERACQDLEQELEKMKKRQEDLRHKKKKRRREDREEVIEIEDDQPRKKEKENKDESKERKRVEFRAEDYPEELL